MPACKGLDVNLALMPLTLHVPLMHQTHLSLKTAHEQGGILLSRHDTRDISTQMPYSL